MNKVGQLHKLAIDARLPVITVRQKTENEFEIQLSESASTEQQAQAQIMAASFVYVTPEKQLDTEDILNLLVKEGVISKAKIDAAKAAK